jgi:hypothetical protein
MPSRAHSNNVMGSVEAHPLDVIPVPPWREESSFFWSDVDPSREAGRG